MVDEFSQPVVQGSASSFKKTPFLHCMLLAFMDTIKSPEFFISNHNGNWVKTRN